MILDEPNPVPLRLFARARRVRGTHHRVSIPTASLAAVRAHAQRHVVTGRSTAKVLRRPKPTPPLTTSPLMTEGRRQRLARLLARRGRMSALVKGVRDPARHGALRTAILRLDATILALRRTLERAA